MRGSGSQDVQISSVCLLGCSLWCSPVCSGGLEHNGHTPGVYDLSIFRGAPASFYELRGRNKNESNYEAMFCQMDKKRLVRHIAGYLPFDHRVRTSRLYPPTPPIHPAPSQVTKTAHLLLILPPCVVIGAKLFSRLPSFHDLIFALPPLFFFSLSDWYSTQMDLLKWGWKKKKVGQHLHVAQDM